jgi:hypothetical protein
MRACRSIWQVRTVSDKEKCATRHAAFAFWAGGLNAQRAHRPASFGDGYQEFEEESTDDTGGIAASRLRSISGSSGWNRAGLNSGIREVLSKQIRQLRHQRPFARSCCACANSANERQEQEHCSKFHSAVGL